MINLKVVSTAAIMALTLPVVLSSASQAQIPDYKGRGGGGGAYVAGSKAAPAPGGNFRPGGVPSASVGGGGGFKGGGIPQAGGGGPRYSGGGGGGGYYRGGGGGGYYRGGGGGGGFIPGAVAGAVIGGAIAAGSGGYYGGPAYAPGYYDDGYYDDGAVAVAPAPTGGDDSVSYCMQRYRSYDPNSGTYLGNDGYRHPCP